MKTAYTEYRVVLRDPETGALCAVPSENEDAALATAAYFLRHKIPAAVQVRDISEWRREDV